MKFTNKTLLFSLFFICALVATVFFIYSSNKSSSAKVNNNLLSAEDIKKSIDANEDITILDVRTPDEYQTGHLKNSKLLTLETISTKAAKIIPDKNKKYYVYCRTGRRSAQAVAQLQQMGYTNVWDMNGGITTWIKMGFPVEK